MIVVRYNPGSMSRTYRFIIASNRLKNESRYPSRGALPMASMTVERKSMLLGFLILAQLFLVLGCGPSQQEIQQRAAQQQEVQRQREAQRTAEQREAQRAAEEQKLSQKRAAEEQKLSQIRNARLPRNY